jgi:hypothetical protein
MLARIWGGRKMHGAPVVVTMAEQEDIKRDQQKNIKATAACLEIFRQCARAQGVSEAALFEDLVAERQAALRKAGVKFRSVR